MATLEQLVVKISADTTQIQQQLDQLQQTVTAKTKAMSGAMLDLRQAALTLLPAFSAVAAVSFFKNAIAEADHIHDLSQRIGVLGSTLSALNIPLKQSGSSVDEFAASINIMNNNIGEAAKGTNQGMVKAFDDIGLSVRALQELSPEDQFYEIVKALAAIDEQWKQTEAGRNIFGRGFAALIPLIKETNGSIDELVEKQKKLGNALTEDDLKRIDEFGDAWTEVVEQLKIAMTAFTPILEGIVEAFKILKAINPVNVGSNVGAYIGGQLRGNPNVSTTRPQTVDQATFGGKFDVLSKEEQATLDRQGRSARGGNAGLIQNKELDSARKSLQDYIKDLNKQNEILRLTPKEQMAVAAGYKAQELAMKAKIDLSAEEVSHIEDIARANYDLSEAMREQIRFSQELKDKFSDALTDIALNFDNAGDAASSFLKTIAQMVIQKGITGPLVDSLLGTSSGGSGILDSIFSGLGFAEGGRPPVGKASMVGEDGPELWVPDQAGTIVPRSGGGQTVIVQQTLHFSQGVQDAARAEIMNALPLIVSASKEAVFSSIQRGGAEARLVGRRNG